MEPEPEPADRGEIAPVRRPRRTRGVNRLTALVAGVFGGLFLLIALVLPERVREDDLLAIRVGVPLRRAPDAAEERPPAAVVTVYVGNRVVDLERFFQRINYGLERIWKQQEAVPRIYVSFLPDDYTGVTDVTRRKSLFIRSLLPLVLRENERLRRARARVQGLAGRQAASGPLSDEERAWLADLTARYGTERSDHAALLRRLDVIPPSLALAQAATESGWGTSRFVQQANALFGQWTWSRDQPGIVPKRRPRGARYRVRAFETLRHSVRAYMHTLNTHWGYEAFRKRREAQRRRGRIPDGVALAGEMTMYSEKRLLYIAMLRRLIRGNGLQRLDSAYLAPAPGTAREARPAQPAPTSRLLAQGAGT